ncbi:hypothetical protein HU200_005083 [Digitaria exilis]|uniref:F-box domain-containing protein n=1 Tax=Digitaria exilis TaxID=1010633 RepID=A0A835FRL0_9POAL|nr:hypothetical protein HU200_005083 [Digitaria exilis]
MFLIVKLSTYSYLSWIVNQAQGNQEQRARLPSRRRLVKKTRAKPATELAQARDWSELPRDAIASILMGAGLVCHSWLDAAMVPYLWRSVDMASPNTVVVREKCGRGHEDWVSARPSPDASRRFHLVELRSNAKDLSSLAQAPAASPQTRLEGLARLQAPDYNTWCVQAPPIQGVATTNKVRRSRQVLLCSSARAPLLHMPPPRRSQIHVPPPRGYNSLAAPPAPLVCAIGGEVVAKGGEEEGLAAERGKALAMGGSRSTGGIEAGERQPPSRA